MSPADIRVKILELARPQNDLPDIKLWLARADALEAWVVASTGDTPPAAEGQAATPLQKRSPGKSRKPGDPEFGPAFNV